MNGIPLVSVIIPTYNASLFIAETLISIQIQTISNWEVIIINDGSTDNTADIIQPFLNDKIKLINQHNQGVSAARNKGFKKSKGEFVVFLDADDILSKNFIEERYKFLKSQEQYGFCCSDIIMFQDNTDNIIWKHKGVYGDIPYNLLNYIAPFESVPSNYMFRKDVIIKNKILFNPLLSSTADRYFLLELNQSSKGGYVADAPVFYRYHSKSMSSQLSEALIKDNELFYKLLNINKLYIKKHFRQYSFHKYYILGLSFLKLKKIKGLYYLFIGSVKHPYLFIKQFINKTF